MKSLILLFILIFTFSSIFAQENKKEDTKLAEYIGQYKMESFFELGTITEKDGFLYAELDSYGINKLLKEEAADTFKSTSSYGTVFTFKRDSTNKVIGVSLKLMDNEVNGIKVK